jgi:hypothetical protein
MSVFISASSLLDFISCEQKAYYRIFEKGEAIPTPEMLLGSITHKVLEKAWDDKDKAIALAQVLCKESPLSASVEQQCISFVDIYFDKFKFLLSPTDKIEQRFKVKYPLEDVYLVGVFDRITGGKVFDWKTNARPPKRISGNIQFILYDIAYRLIYGKESEGIYMASLKDGSMVRYTKSKDHYDALVNQVVPDFVRAVRTKSFIKTGLFTGACFRCQNKASCLNNGDTNVMDYTEYFTE